MRSRGARWFTVFGFDSTHLALDAERLLQAAEVDVVPIPAPPAFLATCGIALRVPLEETVLAESVMSDAGIAVSTQNRMEDH